jgi:hypothetical protein
MNRPAPALFLSSRKYRNFIILRQAPRMRSYGNDPVYAAFPANPFRYPVDPFHASVARLITYKTRRRECAQPMMHPLRRFSRAEGAPVALLMM